MKARIVYIFLLMFLGIYIAVAQRSIDSLDSTRDRIFSRFEAEQALHREKLFLHLSQPYYGAGDTIRFKAYLTDAVFHRPDTLSNFLYVDLSDRLGKVVASRKIKRDSLGFANGLPLPDTLPAGEYTLRAYTGWMLNFDPAFFFRATCR